jgi:hypothetical protein
MNAYKAALAAAVEASVALSASIEVYFEAPPGGAGGVPDPASLLLARALTAATTGNKAAALPAAASALDGAVRALAESHARYGGLNARIEKRKAALLEFDAYKRKVETLRAAPPKNDADKLPRNEEKLAQACTELAAANDELISQLIELEKSKPSMLSAQLPAVVAAAAAFHASAAATLQPVAEKAKSGGGGAPAGVKAGVGAGAGAVAAAALADDPFGAEGDPPVMEFKPSVHLSVAEALPSPPPASAAPAAHPFGGSPGGGGDPFAAPPPPHAPPPPSPPPAAASTDPFAAGAEDDNPFGAPPPPPPPPPFPPPGAGGVPGVDDFDNF